MGRSQELTRAVPEDFVLPAEWGAQVDYLSWDDPFTLKDKLVLHHGGGPNYAGSVNPDPEAQVADEMRKLREWEAYHLSKYWVSNGVKHYHRGLDYSLAIGQSGNVYVARGFNLNGAHWGNDDVDGDGAPENREALAVVFIGGSGQSMSQAAKDSFIYLRNWAALHQDRLGPLGLSYHQEVAASGSRVDYTACPGEERIAWIKEVRSEKVRPSDDFIDYCFASGLALGDPEYWKHRVPADSPEWKDFVAMLQRGILGWFVDMGIVGGDPYYWLTLDPASPEWQDYWKATEHGPFPRIGG